MSAHNTVLRLCVFYMTAIAALSAVSAAHAAPGRWERELSGHGWRLWLDEDADWKNDNIYLPPVDVSVLPVKPPSCGWDGLGQKASKIVEVPGTVEEHYWGANGNPLGIASDYRGVSWWSTEFELPSSLEGKRIALAFDSVNLRAEVFVNRSLAGYDVIGNTPFEIDITDAVVFGAPNRLDVRITDPVGNFDWNDNDVYRWGANDVPAVHGFGGITGRVYLRATDRVRIDDVYVENKPKVKEVEVFIILSNDTGRRVNGDLYIAVANHSNPTEVIWKKSIRVTVPPEGTVASMYIKAGKAKPWSIGNPNLYVAAVAFRSADGGIVDSMNRRFGFRWFTVGEKNGDRRFYLNGDRVFMFCAMTRGYWPKNGMFPTPEMVRRDIEAMRMFGYNTMLFHRAIGQHYVTEACDEAGYLVYEEPSGYPCIPGVNEMTSEWRREKLRRMVMRDRSYPSVVIYNLKNEATAPPDDDDIANIRLVQKLDPGRIVTYNSDRNRDKEFKYGMRLEKDPYKLHVLPFDKTLYYDGWFDHHHWFRYPGYVDECYNNPRFYLRGVVSGASGIEPADSLNRLAPDEIIFWGEEGQWGTMMRLEKIRDELGRTDSSGWREKELLNWYDYYDRFLDESGFRSSFATVDDLTLSMGRNLHYFHGRILENVRMGNISDGYNLNGWAAPVTAEDIADVYRYPTADPSILSYYSSPLYIAVKVRDKVHPSGSRTIADFFIINEKNVRGKHTLVYDFVAPDGASIFRQEADVVIAGGEEFGQLLVEGVELPVMRVPGYYTLKARLMRNDTLVATGADDIFVVDISKGPGMTKKAALIDTSGIINGFLAAARNVTLPSFDPAGPDVDMIVLGAHDFQKVGSASYRGRYINAVMDRVANGATLIILEQADLWASQVMDNLFRHPALYYTRSVHWGSDGRFIAGKSDCLEGLPQSQGMNWEYQTFYRGDVWGIDIDRTGNELIVGLACENRRDIVTALCRVPFGNGQVYLCTLPVLGGLASDSPQSVVAKKLFLNLIGQTAPTGKRQ